MIFVSPITTFFQLAKVSKHSHFYTAAILPLSMYLKRNTSTSKIYKNVHSSSFIITKDLNKPKCPSTVEYYKTMKKSMLLLHAKTWMNLTDIALSERRQIQNNCFHLYKVQRQLKLTHGDRRTVVILGGYWSGMGPGKPYDSFMGVYTCKK